MTELVDLSSTELLSLFESRRASPVEVVEAYRERTQLVDGTLNACMVDLSDQALLEAQESERRWCAGTARVLEGVPYGLKDIIATAGVRTTAGSALFSTHISDFDAVVAERLANAGGVRLAKLHTFEFACGGAENQTFGRCRNPWDPSRTTGGSSSGAGAAVASGQVSFAIGTDTGGSIRQPSSYCGLTGLKPTYGLVPRHGVMPLSWTLDHVGPMTHSVADAALVLSAIAGYDSRDITSSRRDVPDYRASVLEARDLVVGRPRGWFEDQLEESVAAAFETAVLELVDAGVRVVDVRLPKLDIWEVAAWQIMYAEMLSLHQHHVSDVENRDAGGASMLSASPYISAVDYLRALRYRRVAQEDLADAMKNVSALVTPSSTSVAPRFDAIAYPGADAKWLATVTRNTLPFNYTGNPAICLQAGLVEGMPVSIQLVARPHHETVLFSLGAAYQRATSHHKVRPPLGHMVC